MSENIFYENQYLGLNKISLIRRLVLGVFSFSAYYWSTSQGSNGDIYFFTGIFIILISIILLFILHFQTKVVNGCVILDGLWTSRKVKITISSLISCKEILYSKYIINRSVYNLHRKGTIRFYTRGDEALELKDKDGLKYIIGSQKAPELNKIINKIINK